MCCYLHAVDVKCMLMLHVKLPDGEPYVLLVGGRRRITSVQPEKADSTEHQHTD